MDGVVRLLTLVVLAVPAGLLVLAHQTGRSGLYPAAGFVLALLTFIYLWWRPGAFVLEDRDLVLHFPVRTRRLPYSSLSGARLIKNRRALRDEFGQLVRVGAGGFMGAFGFFWGRKRGSLDGYVSRQDAFVLIERTGLRPLLITPEHPGRFIAALNQHLDRAPH